MTVYCRLVALWKLLTIHSFQFHSHSQMKTSIFDAFETREQQVKDHMAGCGMRYGMDCTCGPNCRCQNCPIHSPPGGSGSVSNQVLETALNDGPESIQPDMFDTALQVDQHMDFFGMKPPAAGAVEAPMVSHAAPAAPAPVAPSAAMNPPANNNARAQRNPSVISYGNGLRHMSLTSETTFGRAMSGLSALSIDWENLEDFDVDVDHSAHINVPGNSPSKMQAYATADHHHGGPRRSSMRRSFLAHSAAAAIGASGSGDAPEAHVSFKE